MCVGVMSGFVMIKNEERLIKRPVQIDIKLTTFAVKDIQVEF